MLSFLNRRNDRVLWAAFFVIFWMGNVSVYGQYRIESWTTENGLPQNTVYSIVQTPDGYLWFTTLDGLVRFDGVRFTVFNKNNTQGIESNRFTRLVLDGRGNLWGGTESDFVTRYHQGTFYTFRLGNGSESVAIYNIYLDAGQQAVIATDKGSFQWNGESFVEYPSIASGKWRNPILWSKSGVMWYADGPKLFQVADRRTIEFRLPVASDIIGINGILEDSRGRLWLGTQLGGLFYLEKGKIEKFPLDARHKDVTPGIEDAEGNVWVSANGAAVIAPDDSVQTVSTEQGLSEDSLVGTFQDREGNIWAGTAHNGLNRLNRQSVEFYSEKHGLASKRISPIFQDRDGDIWIGGELTRYSNGKFQVVPRTGDFAKTVTAIGQDHTGRLWFGHWGGAFYLENEKFTDFTGKFGGDVPVFAIHEDGNKTIWFGTGQGLFRYQNDEMKRLMAEDGLAGNDVKVIKESPDGTLWIGSYGGLTRIKDGVLTAYKKNDGLASDQVRSLHEDKDSVLWIGSYDGGLTRFKDGKFVRYTTNEGLFNDGVFQILEDERGNFWMSSNRGIYRVAKQQLNDFADGKLSRIESVAYSKADGLLETECNGGQQPAGIRTNDGQLWFPTQGGVAVIKPTTLKTNPLPPPVVIEGVKIDNETSPLAASIDIAPGKNNLEINYTALSFIKPEFIKFRYRLEGQDENWIEAGDRRTAYYSYLPPGEYSFQVIAANSDGVWNNEGARVKVIVTPPFYRTWWFWILAVVLVFGVAYLLYRARMKQVEARRRRQEEFSQQLLASQEAERQRVAAELHDGLGQSLLLIKNRALLGTMSPDDREEAQEQFEEISRASSHAIEEVREIAYNLRPYHLDRLGLTQSINAMMESIDESTMIEFAYDVMPLDGVFAKDEEVVVYRIVQESINNILKHSEATEASVLIHPGAVGVTMTIEDNGRGFTPNLNNRAKGGFGLIGLDERVRMLRGVLQIRSEPGNGTTIIIKELAKTKKF